MPIGIMIIKHDEIKGPQMVAKKFNKDVDISPDFIAQLYLSHAGFNQEKRIEMKYQNFIVISYFTGNRARNSKSEGIFVLFCDQTENTENYEPFISRWIDYLVKNPHDESLAWIMEHELKNYVEVLNLFQNSLIEDIERIYLIKKTPTSWSFYVRFEFNHLKTDMSYSTKKDQSRDTIISEMDLLLMGKLKEELIVQKIEETINETYFLMIVGNARSRKLFVEIGEKCIKLLNGHLEFVVEALSLIFFPTALKIIKNPISIIPTGENENVTDISNNLHTTSVLSKSFEKMNRKQYSEYFDEIYSGIINGNYQIIPHNH